MHWKLLEHVRTVRSIQGSAILKVPGNSAGGWMGSRSQLYYLGAFQFYPCCPSVCTWSWPLVRRCTCHTSRIQHGKKWRSTERGGLEMVTAWWYGIADYGGQKLLYGCFPKSNPCIFCRFQVRFHQGRRKTSADLGRFAFSWHKKDGFWDGEVDRLW